MFPMLPSGLRLWPYNLIYARSPIQQPVPHPVNVAATRYRSTIGTLWEWEPTEWT